MYISENMKVWHLVHEEDADHFSVSFRRSLRKPYETITITECLTSFPNIIYSVLLKTCNNIKFLKSDTHFPVLCFMLGITASYLRDQINQIMSGV
jgi:hypothetical protein